MPDAPTTAPTTAPAAQVAPVAPQDPKDAPATKNGVPLTAGASLEDLLQADPLGPAEITIPEAPPAPVEAPPIEAPPPVSTEPVEAPLVEEPPAETPPPAFDEEREIQRLVQQKTDLLRTQGRKNQELGDLRREVTELRQQLQQVQAAPPQAAQPALDPADLAARLLDRPQDYLLTPAQVQALARQEAAALLQQQTEQWQEQQVAEAAAIAPEVGKDLFLARHGIKQDFDSWCVSDEGKAVNALFERDTSRSRLLEAYRDDANPRGIADVLTQALQAHRIGKKAAQGRHAQNGEKARIEAAHPPSAPVRPATPPPVAIPGEKSIFDPSMTEAELNNWMKGAQQWERDAQ